MCPKSTTTIYHKVILPRSLYACELWNKLTNKELQELKVMQRYLAKQIQHFHTRTRSIITLGMLGWQSIDLYIDKAKLYFFRRLCHLHDGMLAKQVFIKRLCMWDASNKTGQTGFIPDVARLFDKYNLLNHLDKYIKDGIFPNKYHWKLSVESVLANYTSTKEKDLCNNDSELQFYRQLCLFKGKCGNIVYNNAQLHIIWQLVPTNRHIRFQLIFLASLCTVVRSKPRKICEYCDLMYDHFLIHLLTSCKKYKTAREVYWNFLIDILPPSCSAYLHNLSDWDFICLILKKQLVPQSEISLDHLKDILIITAKVWYCLRKESTKLGLWYGGSE